MHLMSHLHGTLNLQSFFSLSVGNIVPFAIFYSFGNILSFARYAATSLASWDSAVFDSLPTLLPPFPPGRGGTLSLLFFLPFFFLLADRVYFFNVPRHPTFLPRTLPGLFPTSTSWFRPCVLPLSSSFFPFLITGFLLLSVTMSYNRHFSFDCAWTGRSCWNKMNQ